MKLRTLVKRGTLRTVKNNEGVYEFDTRDLDALRATLAPGATATKSHPVAASTSITSAAAPAAPVNVGSPPPVPTVTADFLLAASSARADAGDEDASDDDNDDTPQPPFWMSGTGSEPTYPTGVPYIDPTTYRVFYKPEPVTAVHAPGSVGAVVQELQAKVAELQAQLATITTAWRHQRVAVIAAEIAVEALMSGTQPQVAMVARDASHAAAAALTDDELRREDGYPQAVARGAGVIAAQQAGAALAHAWQAQQAAWSPSRDAHDEVARARARRRSRAPRR